MLRIINNVGLFPDATKLIHLANKNSRDQLICAVQGLCKLTVACIPYITYLTNCDVLHISRSNALHIFEQTNMSLICFLILAQCLFIEIFFFVSRRVVYVCVYMLVWVC